MDELQAAASKIKWAISIPNAKEGHNYDQTIDISQCSEQLILESVTGLSEQQHGLKISIADDKRSFSIKGTPKLDHFRKDGGTAPSNLDLHLFYRFSGLEMPDSRPSLEHSLPFIINQDPQKLVKNIPVQWDAMDPNLRYEKVDEQSEYIRVDTLADGNPQKDVVVASKRGRSHANEGKPRDDDYKVMHLENGWYVLAVGDGAGSAHYSREGSRIACEVASNYCANALIDIETFEEHIIAYKGHQDEEKIRKAIGDELYKILGNAALQAHRHIVEEAKRNKKEPNQYATTLLLSICKRFNAGWFIATFWVGDGAICLYNKKDRIAKILGIPDEGEYGGQTRFLTMAEIFKDSASVYQRLRFEIVDDFTALFLMTDGISDPKFATLNNLESINYWDALWEDLRGNGVELSKGNEAVQKQLLDWLDFWAVGNHDDRTIAILFGDDESEATPKPEGVEEVRCPSEEPEIEGSLGSDDASAETAPCYESCQEEEPQKVEKTVAEAGADTKATEEEAEEDTIATAAEAGADTMATAEEPEADTMATAEEPEADTKATATESWADTMATEAESGADTMATEAESGADTMATEAESGADTMATEAAAADESNEASNKEDDEAGNGNPLVEDSDKDI